MLRAIGPILACAMMVGIVACAKRDPVADEANKTAGLPTINDSVPDATGAPPQNGTAPATQTQTPASMIPAALHGRWGLSPGDCMSTRGDAKGLLVISDNELRFYESRAVPAANARSNENSISGDFAFTGEGQTWTKFQSLQLQKQELVRTESNPTASFTYAKCT